MDRGFALSLFLILIAWALVIFGFYIIAEALVPIETKDKLMSRVIGIAKVVGAFFLLGILLYAWFLLTKYFVVKIKTSGS